LESEAYNFSTMQAIGKLPRIGAIVAFFIAGIVALEGLSGPIVLFLANKEHPAGAKARVILWASSV
jgi:hypothetical protein